MSKIILVVDQPGWAFAHNAEQIKKHFGYKYDFSIVSLEDIKPEECDTCAVYWWHDFDYIVDRIKAKKYVFGLYDHWSWRNYPEKFIATLEKADGLWVANERLLWALDTLLEINKPVWLCPDGVDHEIFPVQIEWPREFIAGWTGNSENGPANLKGLKILEAACEKAEVPFRALSRHSGNAMPHAEMATKFYREISVYLCASEAEGTPNPVLEAMACGRPVLSTAVGITDNLLIDGINGFYVDRDIDKIADRLRYMKQHCDYEAMGRWAHRASLKHSWAIRAKAFDNMLTEVLNDL